MSQWMKENVAKFRKEIKFILFANYMFKLNYCPLSVKSTNCNRSGGPLVKVLLSQEGLWNVKSLLMQVGWFGLYGWDKTIAGRKPISPLCFFPMNITFLNPFCILSPFSQFCFPGKFFFFFRQQMVVFFRMKEPKRGHMS